MSAMSDDYNRTVSSLVRFLLSVMESDVDSIHREFAAYGSGDSTLLLQKCLDQWNGGDIQNLQLKRHLVSAIFKYLMGSSNFATIFRQALQSTSMNEGFLVDLSNSLSLSLAEKIGLGLVLFESDNLDLRMIGQNFCIALIEDLISNAPTSVAPHEQIQDIILSLYCSEGLSKHVDSFTKLLSLLSSAFFTQAPVLTDDMHATKSLRQLDLLCQGSDDDFESVLSEIEKEMSMSETMRELGYGCTASTSHCKEMLSLFLPLDEVTLSKLLGTIARTHIGYGDPQDTYLSFCSALGSNSICESSLQSDWNVDVLVESIKQIAPDMNWTCVMENLDHEGFNIPDKTSFALLMSIYSKACRVLQDPFPLHAICGSVWKNAEGQLSFLEHAVSVPHDIFTFAHCSRQLNHAAMTHLSKGGGNQAWYCLDLFDVLCQLADRGHIGAVRLMFEHPLKELPDVLLVGVAHVSIAYNIFQSEVLSTVFPVILNDSTKNNVIHHLWEVNPNLVVRGFINTHTKPNSLFRIVEICQELKILSSILNTTPFIVSFRLAAYAYREEHIHLEKWLSENLTMYKDVFFQECLSFLKEVFFYVKHVALDDNLQRSQAYLMNFYEEIYPTFFKVLWNYSGQLSSLQLFEEFERLHGLSNSKVQNSLLSDISTSDGSPDDKEGQANAYLHELFSGLLPIDAMVQMLARFKESFRKRENLIFESTIANLFEEYKFFPDYPDRKLKIAAILFGSLIKNQLVTDLSLDIAFGCVLDALRNSVDSKMFMFGIKALEQFIDHLVEWPQYCNQILQISHLRVSHAELVSVIEHALGNISSSEPESIGGNSLPVDQHQASVQASIVSKKASEASSQFVGSRFSPFQFQEKHHGFLGDGIKPTKSISAPVTSVINPKPNAHSFKFTTFQHSASVPATVSSSQGLLCYSCSITPEGMLRTHSCNTGFGSALNIETLVTAAERRDTPIEAPAPEVQDKMLFMINNISIRNIEAKAKEFAEVMKEMYYPWFAQYMVMKRASIEPNNHDMYLKFLDKVNSKTLNMEIEKATYENCKVLLRSGLIKSSSEERSLLKNLGSWLGKLTIGRNKSLRYNGIDPKSHIIEAYEKGLMIAVIPFTSKVLEPCRSSLAYKPFNPWTMSILCLLAEIYNLPNLKMNLKFDIEVLFKNLGVDMKDVEPTSLLKDKVREVEGNPDFSIKDISVSQSPIIAEVSSAIAPAMNQVELQPDFNSLSRPVSHPNVLTQYAPPLHHGSNTIVEDEKDDPVITFGHVPSAPGLTQVKQSDSPFSLSQLLAMVPAYESHININAKLNFIGSQIHRLTKTALDNAIKDILLPVVQRSVTAACWTTKTLVVKDYAMVSDDGAIASAAHQMVGSLAGLLAHVSSKENLRVALLNHLHKALNMNGELLDQIVQLLTNDNIDVGCAIIKHIASRKAVELIDGEIGPSFATIRQQREAVGSAYYDAGNYAQGPLALVPEALRPKPGRISDSQQRVYTDFGMKTWQNQSSQSSNVAPFGLPGLCGSVNSSLSWAYGSGCGQLSSNIHSTSQVAPLFNAAQQLDLIQEASDHGSGQLGISSSTVGPNDAFILPAIGISSRASSFTPIVMPPELHTSETSDLGAVVKLSPINLGAERLKSVFAELLLCKGDGLDMSRLLAQMVPRLFSAWCSIYEFPSTYVTTQFISLLQQSGLLNGDDSTDQFFRIFMEHSIAHYLEHEQVISSVSLSKNLSFVAIDAYSKLVFLILKFFPADLGTSKVVLFTKILSVTVRAIQMDAEEKKKNFSPSPYLKLFINWLLELPSDPVLDRANFQVLTSLAAAFHELQPLKVPGFSFAWLELVSHRNFMPKLLISTSPNGWPHFQCLLVDLFKFLEPSLRNVELGEPVRFLYRNTMKLLVVLLQDFPEFLCDYHFSFCDVIPINCVQMRNIILYAYPRNIRVLHPLTPNLKIDLLPEINQPPKVLSDVDGALKVKQIKAVIDAYMQTKPEGSAFLSELKYTLLLPQNEAELVGTKYSVPLINSLVLYVGMKAIQQLQIHYATQYTLTQQIANTHPMDIFLASAAMDIFQTLINDLDTEGHYLFLNAVVNQLRYPNIHTHYFSYVLLYLFVDASQEIIQEQITRVLLERLMAKDPYPWGLIVAFLELYKNPRYAFLSRRYIKCSPEIAGIVESIARTLSYKGSQ